MSRIERSVTVTVSVEGSLSSGAVSPSPCCNDGRAQLLPEPACACGAGSIAEALAKLVLQSAITQRKSARASEAAEDQAQHVAEDRQVAEMREKAIGMRWATGVEGGLIAAGGVVTACALLPTAKGTCDSVRQLGEQTSSASKIASGFGAAAQTEHEATIEEQRAFAQRALRASDDAKRGLQEFADLAGKALAFVRDAARTQADCNLAAVRWG